MNELAVFLDGRPCGVLQQSISGDLAFEYDAEYARTATPLSLSMPMARTRHKKKSVLPFLDGLLPDNIAAREAMAHGTGANWRNPFSLLSVMGTDVAGALQTLPVGRASDDAVSTTTGTPVSRERSGQMLGAVQDNYRDGRTAGAPRGQDVVGGLRWRSHLRHRTV